jgi:chromosome segregation ATPase
MKPDILNQNALNNGHLTDLADQLDPAIGEASSVMGAMATEMIRRSLRGGVLTIGRELTGYVSQQVEHEIVEQRPAIEKAAAETATEVARGEIESVRHAAREQGQQLAARIDDASRQAQERAETVARELAGRLDESSRRTQEELATVSKVIDDATRQSSEATATLARSLETEVGTARKELTSEIETFKERARQATAKIKDRLDKLDATSAQLADLQRALKAELVETLRREQRQLHTRFDELRSTNQALAERLEILERPRGLRRLFAWLFGKNKKTAASETTASTEETNEDHPARSAGTKT